MELDTGADEAATPLAKFTDPDWTAKREPRATVALDRLDTLWINTGTLCNITCQNCYIESSPSNDRLVYITAAEVAAYLDEIKVELSRPRPLVLGDAPEFGAYVNRIHHHFERLGVLHGASGVLGSHGNTQ